MKSDPAIKDVAEGFNVKLTSRNHAMAMAAQLRLVAELLESGEMVSKSGGIMVNSNHSGDVTIESSLILSCVTQPTVEDTQEVEEITLFDPITQAAYDFLDRLDPGEKKLTTFDHGEDEQWSEWMRVINNRGDYPDFLKGRMFEVKPYRNMNELGFWTVRLV